MLLLCRSTFCIFQEQRGRMHILQKPVRVLGFNMFKCNAALKWSWFKRFQDESSLPFDGKIFSGSRAVQAADLGISQIGQCGQCDDVTIIELQAFQWNLQKEAPENPHLAQSARFEVSILDPGLLDWTRNKANAVTSMLREKLWKNVEQPDKARSTKLGYKINFSPHAWGSPCMFAPCETAIKLARCTKSRPILHVTTCLQPAKVMQKNPRNGRLEMNIHTNAISLSMNITVRSSTPTAGLETLVPVVCKYWLTKIGPGKHHNFKWKSLLFCIGSKVLQLISPAVCCSGLGDSNNPLHFLSKT